MPPPGPTPAELQEAEKKALFTAARAAMEALKPTPAARFVLEQLCGFYRGSPIEGRMLVWPSNELLCQRTGLAERTIRLAIRQLIELGVIISRDSPNGKRFAQRWPNGQIKTAYGFDLSPLLARAEEFQERLAELRAAANARSMLFDAMTIARRATLEAIRTIAEWFPTVPVEDLERRYEELTRQTPRRTSSLPVEPVLNAWEALRTEAEHRYFTAYGGTNCRHKDNNNDALDQSCNKASVNVSGAAGPAPRPIPANLGDLLKACPEALEFTGPIHNEAQLVATMAHLRGAFGVHVKAWEEAVASIGPVRAAALLLFVVQVQANPAPGADQIANPGGYFRAMARLINDGRIDLNREIQRLLARKYRGRAQS